MKCRGDQREWRGEVWDSGSVKTSLHLVSPHAKRPPGSLVIQSLLSSAIIWCINSNINTYLTSLMREPWDNARKSNEIIIIIIITSKTICTVSLKKGSHCRNSGPELAVLGAKASAPWQPRGAGGGLRRRGHVCACGWLMVLYGRNQHYKAIIL